MNALIRSLSAEFLKIRKTLALGLTFLAPWIILLAVFAFYMRDSEYFMNHAGTNPWTQLSQFSFLYWNLLMIPLFITLETALLGQLEDQQKNWKLLYSQPVPRGSLYFAKQIVAMGLIAISTITLTIGLLALGAFLQWIEPAFGFNVTPPWKEILTTAVVTYLTSWFMISFHLWISIRSESFVIASATGIALTILAFFLFNETAGNFYPWTIPAMLVLKIGTQEPIRVSQAIGVAGGVLLSLLASFDISRKDIV